MPFFSDFIPLLNLELEGLDDMADILRNKTSQAKMMIIFANIFPIFRSLQTMHFHEWRIFTTKKLKNMTINKKKLNILMQLSKMSTNGYVLYSMMISLKFYDIFIPILIFP